MFAQGCNDEVQIQNFVMASDRQTDGDVLAMNGASAALCISPLPFLGPLGAVRLGLVDGQFIPFPTHDELEVSELDLIISGSREAVLMIEGFSRELPEDRMLEAIAEAHRYVRELCELQLELVEKLGVKKMDFVVEALGEHRPNGTINETGGQRFLGRGPTFTLEKATREFTGGGLSFAVVASEREVIHSGPSWARGNGTERDRVAILY